MWRKYYKKIIKVRLFSFLKGHNNLLSNQFDYESQNSTNNNTICELTTFINSCFDHTKPCAAILLNFSKTFDTVDNILLFKLWNQRGFWTVFCSYLSDRLQRVKIRIHSVKRFLSF